MKCGKSMVLRFIDKELSEPQRVKFEKHLSECPYCQLQVEKGKALLEGLKEESNHSIPSPQAVMERIDINRYKKPLMKNRISAMSFATFCRKAAVPVISLVLIGILLALPPTRDFIGRGLMTLLDKENRIQRNIPAGSNYLSFTGAFEQTAGETLVAELNLKGMGVSPWEVVQYASDQRILLRNYASLLVYSNGEVKKVADLDTLGLDHVQGSIVTTFQISSDGRYILAGNQIPPNESTSEPSYVYLFDADTGRYAKLFEGSMSSLASAWSFNGRWLALTPKVSSTKIDIINLQTLEITEEKAPSGEIKAVFISDSGKLAIYGDKRVITPAHGDFVQYTFDAVENEPFYINADKEIIWFVNGGYLSSQAFGSDVIESHIVPRQGSKVSDARIIDSRIQGKYLVSLMEDGQIDIFDLADNSEKFFGVTHKITSGYLPWCTVSPDGKSILWGVEGGFISSNGESELMHKSPILTNVSWKDEKSIVFVEFSGEEDIKAGEFAIKQMDVQTGEVTELYRTVSAPLESQKTYFNRVYVKDNSKAYSEADITSPLAEAIAAQLKDPTKTHELNLFDEVVNGFVHVENDDGIPGWVKEEDFIYYDNYKNFSYEINTLDLNGDNKPDTINVLGGDTFTLEINDTSIDGTGITVSDQFRVVDIDPADPYLEIVIEEFGPSSDTMSSFYYYDGEAIHFMGKLEGLCGNKDSVPGDGKVIGRTRGTILETWFYKDYYKLDGQRRLVQIPQEIYMKMTYPEEPPLKVLIPSLSLVEAPGSSKISLTLKQGDEVFFLGSDDKEWCLFGTADGRKGWMNITKFNRSTELKISAGEVFEGLSNAD